MTTMGSQTLWEYAVAQNGNKTEDNIADHECTILITGMIASGKSTLIHRYLEKGEDPKPSVAIEYSYGRKTNKNMGKDVCHIFELANGTLFLNLIRPTIEARSKQSALALAIVVDLSRPEEIWPYLEALHLSVLQTFLKQERPNFKIAILGSKYDAYQIFDANKRRMINRTIRYFGLLWQSAVLFYSEKDRVLLKQAKDLLIHLTFNIKISFTLSTDPDGPLVVPFNADSVQQLGGPMGDSDARDVPAMFDLWKQTYTTHFPSGIGPAKTFDNPQNFKEPMIDALKAQKDEELDRFRQEMDRRLRHSK